jgi:phospholipid/cholesterol/gamma-HCH transport system ATP-binding protein
VGLARALVMHPEVLLYDEPTTGLDPIMSDVINELMIRTRSRNPVTSVMVTHDMKSASKVADRIVMLYPTARLEPDEPQVIFDGTPQDIEQSKDVRVTQFYLGEAGDRLTEMGENFS